MIALLGIAVVAGVIAGISPCVLPVLPVLFVAGATEGESKRLRRPLAIVAGLVVSFTTVTLAGAEFLTLLHLPLDLLRDAGIALLGLVGLGLCIPALGELIARPFAHIRVPTLNGERSGFVIGLGLGLVFAPCAGPVLTAITVVAGSHHVGFESVLLTLFFSLGAAIPLIVIALAGGELVSRVRTLRQRAPLIRVVGGVVLIAMAVVLATNVANRLQVVVPGYTSALQHDVEGGAFATKQLASIKGTKVAKAASEGGVCVANSGTLGDCGTAAAFTGIVGWLNTPGDRPITLASLRHKVVLVDFWTYSCINCERSLPHVEAWYARYKADGLVVVGIHTPEFAFEHVISNVKAAAAQLGVRYPIAIDNNYATWDAYGNEGWPADYLVDGTGALRYSSDGEGDYAGTEQLIRQLLLENRPDLKLPPPTEVANLTPTEAMTPETYLGYDRIDNLYENLTKGKAVPYTIPASTPPGYFAIGGTWTVNAEEMTAGTGADLAYDVTAKDVYLVMAGSGKVSVSINGKPTRSFSVGGIPKLYTLANSADTFTGDMVVTFTAGVEAYDLTFG
jgi:cytochrome c biogenesis protein CcdA/thiol-disulfide isomerase/thioredoxin